MLVVILAVPTMLMAKPFIIHFYYTEHEEHVDHSAEQSHAFPHIKPAAQVYHDDDFHNSDFLAKKTIDSKDPFNLHADIVK